MAQPVRLYVTEFCGYCRAALRLLEEEGIAYRKIDVSNDPAMRERIVDETGWRTVPVVFVGDEMIGGYSELAGLAESGELQAKIAAGAKPAAG